MFWTLNTAWRNSNLPSSSQVLVSDHLSDDATHSDLKQQYVRLLNEREQLICIRESMSKELRASEEERKQAEGREDAFKERLRHLERELNQASTEKSMLEKRLKVIKLTPKPALCAAHLNMNVLLFLFYTLD